MKHSQEWVSCHQSVSDSLGPIVRRANTANIGPLSPSSPHFRHHGVVGRGKAFNSHNLQKTANPHDRSSFCTAWGMCLFYWYVFWLYNAAGAS